MDFEVRAWCTCGIGVTVATFHVDWNGRQMPSHDDAEVLLPRLCICGRTGLNVEAVQHTPTGLEWLVALDERAQSVYLAARRAGADHQPAVGAMLAVGAPPSVSLHDGHPVTR